MEKGIKEVTIADSEIESSIKKVGKSFSAIEFKALAEKFEQKVDAMKEFAAGHRVRSAATETRSIEIGTLAKTLDKVIDAARMSAKRPYLDFCTSLDGMVRPIQKSLVAVQAGEKAKCIAYRKELLKKQRAAEAVQAKADAAAALAASAIADSAAIEEEAKPLILSALNAPEQKPIKQATGTVMTVAAGSGSYRPVFKANLVDISMVPREYMMIDEKKVNKAVKDGIRNIPGFNIEETVDMRFNS